MHMQQQKPQLGRLAKVHSGGENLSNNMLNSNQNLTDKSLEQKQKEIKKLFPFVSQKPTEKNKSKTQSFLDATPKNPLIN